MNEITLDVKIAKTKIDRNIYGHFAEHLGRCIYEGFWVGEDSPIANTNGIRNDVVAALRKIKVPVLRWPGGCFADEYHWMDGIGPCSQRPTMINTHWGGVVEDNSFGTQAIGHVFFVVLKRFITYCSSFWIYRLPKLPNRGSTRRRDNASARDAPVCSWMAAFARSFHCAQPAGSPAASKSRPVTAPMMRDRAACRSWISHRPSDCRRSCRPAPSPPLSTC